MKIKKPYDRIQCCFWTLEQENIHVVYAEEQYAVACTVDTHLQTTATGVILQSNVYLKVGTMQIVVTWVGLKNEDLVSSILQLAAHVFI